jgi:hypothetical protein
MTFRLGSRGPRHTVSGSVLRVALRATWREARATAKDQRVRIIRPVRRFTRRR